MKRRPLVVVGLVVYGLIVIAPPSLVMLGSVGHAFNQHRTDTFNYRFPGEYEAPSKGTIAVRIMIEGATYAGGLALGLAAIGSLPFLLFLQVIKVFSDPYDDTHVRSGRSGRPNRSRQSGQPEPPPPQRFQGEAPPIQDFEPGD